MVPVTAMFIGIVSSFGLYFLMFFWFYWPTSLVLTAFARSSFKNNPTVLFLIGCVLQVAFIAVYWVIAVALITFTAFAQPRGEPVFLIVLFGSMMLGGLVGWIVLLVKRLGRRSAVRAFRERRPLPKLQYSLREIYTALLYFACSMTFSTMAINAAVGSLEEWVLILVAVYLACVVVYGSAAALSVLRHKTASRNAWARTGLLLFAFLYGTFLLPWLAMAWRAWQRALLFTEMEDERKARAREKLRRRKARLAKLKAQKSGDGGAAGPAVAPSSPEPAQ